LPAEVRFRDLKVTAPLKLICTPIRLLLVLTFP